MGWLQAADLGAAAPASQQSHQLRSFRSRQGSPNLCAQCPAPVRTDTTSPPTPTPLS